MKKQTCFKINVSGKLRELILKPSNVIISRNLPDYLFLFHVIIVDTIVVAGVIILLIIINAVIQTNMFRNISKEDFWTIMSLLVWYIVLTVGLLYYYYKLKQVAKQKGLTNYYIK